MRHITDEYKSTLEGVQLCIANVMRLHEDSQRVSAETKFALLELSLEELMKAWMLFLVFIRENLKDDVDGFLRYLGPTANVRGLTTKVLDIGTTKLGDLSKFKELIGRLFKPDIVDAFKYHDAKLHYLSDLMTYLEIYSSMHERITDPASLIRKVVGNYLKPGDKFEWSSERLNSILNKFDAKDLDNLKTKREDAIYVNKINGVLTLPIVSIFDTDNLDQLVLLLIGSLIVQIYLYNSFKTNQA